MVEDDLPLLVEEIKKADAVVFATPVYFADLSESLKSFLDRLRRICWYETSRNITEGKSAVGICVAGSA